MYKDKILFCPLNYTDTYILVHVYSNILMSFIKHLQPITLVYVYAYGTNKCYLY